MRTALTLARPHGADQFGVVSGPEVSIDAQLQAFKRLQVSGKTHPEIAAAEFWISDSGVTKRLRFADPDAEPVAAKPAPQRKKK